MTDTPANTIPSTWEEKRIWLQEHFMRPVTFCRDPGQFTSRMTSLMLTSGNGTSCATIQADGESYESSIENVFNEVTQHAPGTYLVRDNGRFLDKEYFTVDAKTLAVTPLKPR